MTPPSIRRIEVASLVLFLGILALPVDMAVVIAGRVSPQLSLSIMYVDAALVGAAALVIWAESAALRGEVRW
jgi:hypothetical protein